MAQVLFYFFVIICTVAASVSWCEIYFKIKAIGYYGTQGAKYILRSKQLANMATRACADVGQESQYELYVIKHICVKVSCHDSCGALVANQIVTQFILCRLKNDFYLGFKRDVHVKFYFGFGTISIGSLLISYCLKLSSTVAC